MEICPNPFKHWSETFISYSSDLTHFNRHLPHLKIDAHFHGIALVSSKEKRLDITQELC